MQPFLYSYLTRPLASANVHPVCSRPATSLNQSKSLQPSTVAPRTMAAACSPGDTVTAGGTLRGAGRGRRFLVLRPRGAGRLLPSSVMTTTAATSPARCAVARSTAAVPQAAAEEGRGRRSSGQLAVPPALVDELVEEALVWCSQHGLVVGDKNHPVRTSP